MRYFILFLLLCPTLVHAKKSTFYVNKVYDYPQAKLEEIIEDFDRGGFCAPTAASNILRTFHASRTIDQGEMIKTLASSDYMNTDPNRGTSTERFMFGIEKYASENFRKTPVVHMQGLGNGKDYHTGIYVPEIDWITDGLGMGKGAWVTMHMAKYNEQDDSYHIISGHIVTLVGYNVGARSTIFIVNDSAAPANAKARNEYLKLTPIESGKLTYGAGFDYPATGFLKVIDGQETQYATQSDYDTIIITGAIRLTME